jgi:hypothetical protein
MLTYGGAWKDREAKACEHPQRWRALQITSASHVGTSCVMSCAVSVGYRVRQGQ